LRLETRTRHRQRLPEELASHTSSPLHRQDSRRRDVTESQPRTPEPNLPAMEPRARAAKNVGKMNFSHNELAQLLYAHGDVRNPLPETIRVLDEIVTEFIQGMAFEATRAANYAGRQKVKYEDFEFAFRKNDAFLGKVQEVFEKKGEIESAKKIFTKDDEAVLMKDAADQEHKKDKPTNGTGEPSTAAEVAAKQEEELGEADDDADAESEVAGRPAKRVRLDGEGK
ncbi:transcription initiation factor IID, partial [Colletotrichum tofieldiae]